MPLCPPPWLQWSQLPEYSCSPGLYSGLSRDRVGGTPAPHKGSLGPPCGVALDLPRALALTATSTSCQGCSQAPYKSLSPRDCKALWGKSPALDASSLPQSLNPVPCTLQLFREDLSTLQVCHYQFRTGHILQYRHTEKYEISHLCQNEKRGEERKHTSLCKHRIFLEKYTKN